jgi:hypothetical protein
MGLKDLFLLTSETESILETFGKVEHTAPPTCKSGRSEKIENKSLIVTGNETQF